VPVGSRSWCVTRWCRADGGKNDGASCCRLLIAREVPSDQSLHSNRISGDGRSSPGCLPKFYSILERRLSFPSVVSARVGGFLACRLPIVTAGRVRQTKPFRIGVGARFPPGSFFGPSQSGHTATSDINTPTFGEVTDSATTLRRWGRDRTCSAALLDVWDEEFASNNSSFSPRCGSLCPRGAGVELWGCSGVAIWDWSARGWSACANSLCWVHPGTDPFTILVRAMVPDAQYRACSGCLCWTTGRSIQHG
jgi:hypothetical protein